MNSNNHYLIWYSHFGAKFIFQFLENIKITLTKSKVAVEITELTVY